MHKKPRILFVDDEQHILDSFRASLRKKYTIDTAAGAGEALKKITNHPPYAVIVSDFKMPEMDGVEFLSRIQPLAPETTRVMLTGHADVDTTMLAVNRGQVFRFLTKPTPIEEMERVLELAVQHHKLITAEKELLNGTVRGSIQLLTEVLTLSNPEAFGRAERIKKLSVLTAKQLGSKKTLIMELSAMLSQLGLISLSGETLKKLYRAERLSANERQLYDQHPQVGARLLSNIPRLEKVAEVVALQQESVSANSKLPLESKILKTVLDYDLMRQQGLKKFEITQKLQESSHIYDQTVVEAFGTALRLHDQYVPAELPIRKLKRGMIVGDDIYTLGKVLLVSHGQEITETALERLNMYARNNDIVEPVKVFVQQDNA
ncbi:MAG: response regulator [Desulfovibrio sp.]